MRTLRASLATSVLAAMIATPTAAEAHTFTAFQSTVGFTAANGLGSPAVTGVSPVGLSGEYSHFVMPTAFIQMYGALSYTTGLEVAQFVGGGGNLGLSLVGGMPRRLTADDFHIVYAPRFHLGLFAGLGVRNYDISPYVPPSTPGTEGARLSSPRTGQFFAPEGGLRFDYYLSYLETEVTASARLRVLSSINGAAFYSFLVVQVDLGLGITL